MTNLTARAAFVATNSIAQGKTVTRLWKNLFDAQNHIDFRPPNLCLGQRIDSKGSCSLRYRRIQLRTQYFRRKHTEELPEFIKREPAAEKYIRQIVGAEEFINGKLRYCLWLKDCPPNELRKMPRVLKRVKGVRNFRLASKAAPTRKLADCPTRFAQITQPEGVDFILIPRVSSERRN